MLSIGIISLLLPMPDHHLSAFLVYHYMFHTLHPACHATPSKVPNAPFPQWRHKRHNPTLEDSIFACTLIRLLHVITYQTLINLRISIESRRSFWKPYLFPRPVRSVHCSWDTISILHGFASEHGQPTVGLNGCIALQGWMLNIGCGWIR